VLGGNLLLVAVSGLGPPVGWVLGPLMMAAAIVPGVFVRQERWAAGLVSGLLLALLGWGALYALRNEPLQGPGVRRVPAMVWGSPLLYDSER
jgi:hypothetical protein